jgi:hypothetical protein
MTNALAAILSLLLIGAAPVAVAEDGWKEFVSADGYSSAVATGSIKTAGAQRAFRLRLGKVGDTHMAVADAILDCPSKMLMLGRVALYNNGVQTGTREADPAKPFIEPMSEQPSGDEIAALVCAG